MKERRLTRTSSMFGHLFLGSFRDGGKFHSANEISFQTVKLPDFYHYPRQNKKRKTSRAKDNQDRTSKKIMVIFLLIDKKG